MATLVGTQSDVMDAMVALLEFECNSIELYEAAINRSQEDQYKRMISRFKKDHEDHIAKISQILKDNDLEPVRTRAGKQLLEIAKVAISKAIGNDIEILKIMLHAEEDGIKAYNRMLRYEELPGDYAEAFKRGLTDELKHKEWLGSVILDMGCVV